MFYTYANTSYFAQNLVLNDPGMKCFGSVDDYHCNHLGILELSTDCKII